LTNEFRCSDDGLDALLGVMPPHIREAFEIHPQREDLIEIILDLGRPPEARTPGKMTVLAPSPVERADIEYVVKRIGAFGKDNRAGIERTLHRISAIRNRVGTVIGLTCRVGRAVRGTVDILRDVIELERSILLLGRPGVGKTTILREAARVLADDLNKRVVIVDTSNEIAGDGDIPHPGIGHARRMQVSTPSEQHAVMIEAVENHMPEVIVIDEIGTEAEALAARTIAERGVQLIATAHGNTLDNLMQNPTLSDLVGGIQAVTLGDDEARRRGTRKTVLERKAPPTFEVLVEIQERDRLAVHHDVAHVVDMSLRGLPLRPELRLRTEDGKVEIRKAPTPVDVHTAQVTELRPAAPKLWLPNRKTLRIFPYAVNRSRLDQAIRICQAPVQVVNNVEDADMILMLKSHERHQPKRLQLALSQGMPLHVLRNNTLTQITYFLRSITDQRGPHPERDAAMREVELAVRDVMENQHAVELSPQKTSVRRLQHQFAEGYGLNTESTGAEPQRRVVIYPASGV
jgi:stage III sporulation protein SpoIIIAA